MCDWETMQRTLMLVLAIPVGFLLGRLTSWRIKACKIPQKRKANRNNPVYVFAFSDNQRIPQEKERHQQ